MVSPNIENKRAQVRRKMLEAALRVFARQGFEATTTVQIAEAIGMTGPSLYHYFDTKQDLLFACIELLMQRLCNALDKAGTSADEPLARIEALVSTQLRQEFREEGAGALINAYLYGPRYLTEVLSEGQRALLHPMQRRILDAYRQAIEVARAQGLVAVGDPTLAAFNVLAIIQYTPVWFRRSGRRSQADVIRAQCEAVLLALGARGR